MTKVKCIFDTVGYEKKPIDQMKNIIGRMKKQSAEEYTLGEIKQKLTTGYTIRPAHCGAKEAEWQAQRMFMVDVEKSHRWQDVVDRELKPTFIYTTANHTEEAHRFRVVYVLDNEITDFETAKRVQIYLMDMVGGADPTCKNLNRVYFAGKEVVFEGGLVATEQLETVMGEKGVPYINKYNNSYIYSTPKTPLLFQDNIDAIKNRDSDFFRKGFNPPLKQFENNSEFFSYLYREVNLPELLGIENPSSFSCLFHDDHNPSANIFRNDDGVWLYKCHSSSCRLQGKTLNTQQVIELLGGYKSQWRALKFIKDVYNLHIAESEWSEEQRNNLDMMLATISRSEMFEKLFPQTSKNIKYTKFLFCQLINIAKDNIFTENYTTSEGDIVFFVSRSELAKNLGLSPNCQNKVGQKIAVLVYHDLIRKLDDKDIPQPMLNKAYDIRDANKVSKRVNFYSIPSWVIEHILRVEQQANKWKQYGYTVKGASYEMFCRAEGLDVAQKTYPQHKKIKTETIDIETGEVITAIKDRTTSIAADERVNKIVQTIKQIITEKGYATETETIERLGTGFERNKTQFMKMRGQLVRFGLRRVRANKDLKTKYNMSETGYPTLIIPAEEQPNDCSFCLPIIQ